MTAYMIPELGTFALIVCLCVSALQGVLPMVGAHTGRLDWMHLARPSSYAAGLTLLLAFVSLAWCFYANDFSVAYVAQNSNAQLPVFYRLAAVWGGHEGSLLLWVCMLGLWAAGVAAFSRPLDMPTVARVLAVLGLIQTGLLLFVLFTSNPFERLLPAAPNGRDLNPLLQDPGLIFHPPMLYMGYVGFSVSFAFAIASLIAGRLDAAWVRWSRPWTTLAWVFLTVGIAMGSWWAYYELGWGGWWFWDPVENASFLPWLVGTALLHSLAVTEKRGAFKNWTVLLAIAAFSLSLLGTFLVRSGVLTSVHAFATDPKRGIFILILLTLVVGSSLLLYAWRASQTAGGGSFTLVSREAWLLMGNICLVTAAGSVLLGTLYPLLLDALNLGKISVGPPYFNSVFVPLMVPAILLMVLTPWLSWKQARVRDVWQRWAAVMALALVVGLAVPWWLGPAPAMTYVGVFLAAALVASGVWQSVQRVRSVRGSGSVPGSYWGMQLGHLGVAVFIVGVTLVNTYQQEKDVRMAPGDKVTLQDYTFEFLGVEGVAGPNYQAMRGTFEVRQNGAQLKRLYPEKRQYASSRMPMTEAASDAGLTRDIYVSLGEPLDAQAWAVRVYVKPFVDWIWGGCLIMALGGVLVVLDRRYRKVRMPKAQALDGQARVAA